VRALGALAGQTGAVPQQGTIYSHECAPVSAPGTGHEGQSATLGRSQPASGMVRELWESASSLLA
jgi:hypothetical protein